MIPNHLKAILSLAIAFPFLLCWALYTWQFYPFSTPQQPVTDYLLDSTAFPTGWEATGLFEYRMVESVPFAADAASQHYSPLVLPYHDASQTASHAFHLVAKARSYAFTVYSYEGLLERWFIRRNTLTEWRLPTADMPQFHADESRIGCAIFDLHNADPEPACIYLSRYGQFASLFYVETERSGMTETQFVAAVQRIDEQFREFMK